jgi:hypothetical protein
MESIRSTMRSDLRVISDVPLSPSSYSAMSAGFEQPTFSAVPQQSYSVQENPFAANPNPNPNPFAAPTGGVSATGNRGRGHRGRLFDLVGEEDTEEDQGMNILPMLDGLNMDNMLFGNSNTNEDIDIEAISLMGIGLNSNGASSLNRFGNQS